MSTKTVRFYTPWFVDDDDPSKNTTFDTDFWPEVRRFVGSRTHDQRKIVHSGAPYWGQARTATALATDYLKIGRVRYRADFPETLDDEHETTGELDPGERINLLEPAYLVPFGGQNRVAVMGPLRGMVGVRALERWLSAHVVRCHTEVGSRVELRPLIDRQVLQKLEDSVGVTKVSVHVDRGSEVTGPPPQDFGSTIGAFVATQRDRPHDLNLDISLGFGHGPRTAEGMVDMKRAAQWFARSQGARQVNVNMVLPDGEGLRTEQHELISDRISVQVDLEAPEDQKPSEESVVAGINRAIEQFRAQAR